MRFWIWIHLIAYVLSHSLILYLKANRVYIRWFSLNIYFVWINKLLFTLREWLIFCVWYFRNESTLRLDQTLYYFIKINKLKSIPCIHSSSIHSKHSEYIVIKFEKFIIIFSMGNILFERYLTVSFLPISYFMRISQHLKFQMKNAIKAKKCCIMENSFPRISSNWDLMPFPIQKNSIDFMASMDFKFYRFETVK